MSSGIDPSRVYALRLRVGDRAVDARIREKQQARREFDQAKREGRSASLLEQKRPNVMQMAIANVLPGDEIAVDLRYTETIVPADGTYASSSDVVGRATTAASRRRRGAESHKARAGSRSRPCRREDAAMRLSR